MVEFLSDYRSPIYAKLGPPCGGVSFQDTQDFKPDFDGNTLPVISGLKGKYSRVAEPGVG